VTPTSGTSPLAVSVEATVNTARSCGAASYAVDFGDGSPALTVNVPANMCNEVQQTFSHTYTSGGTYQVLLRAGTHQVAATVNVTQGSTTFTNANDTIVASPTSGAAPLTTTFSGIVNSGAQCNSGPYSLNFGDGQTVAVTVAGCSATSYSVPHTYQTAGSYTARLYRGNPAVIVGSVGITSGSGGSTSGGPFSVSGGIDGNPLRVRALFDITAPCARYDVDWGDGSSHATQPEGSCGSGTVTKDLTHTYSGGGTFTITLKRGSSLTSTDTAGITIAQ
jgi:hypothetical protein